jgi:hypothetical protein
MTRRTTLVALVILLRPLAACDVVPRITTPADRTVVDASRPLTVHVELGDGLAPGGGLHASLLVGVDSGAPQIVDVSASLALRADRRGADGTIAASLLGAGRDTLVVGVDRDGDGASDATTSATFTPLDVSAADRCDLLVPAQCLLPFPNDFFTVRDATLDTGRRVSLVRASMPANASGVHVDPTEWNRNDGWSPGAMILALVPGVDLARTGAAPITDLARSLDADAPIFVIDADRLERKLAFVELDANATDPAQQALIVRPAKNLEEGRRYIVVMRNLRDARGAPIEAGPVFAAYRDKVPTDVPALEARREHMESLFARLDAAGVARRDLYLAWDFTVASERSLSERMLHIRDDAFASLAGGAPAFRVTTVQDLDPATDSRIVRRIEGTFDVPLYLTGTGAPGSRFRDANGQPETAPNALPVRNGVYSARFVCNVPRAVSADGQDPVTAARAAIYGHGLLGDPDEINAGNVKDFSNGHRIVFCATPWIGMAEEDVPNAILILTEISAFPTLADRVQQGILDALFLARLLKDPRGFASDPAFQLGAKHTPVIETGAVYYDGNSQGGIIGGAATAVSTEWTRAVLGVPGMNYSTLLQRSVDFDTFQLVFRPSYPSPFDQALVLSLIQMLWDRAEANGYAHHMTTQPYAGTPEHRVLMHVAFGDHQVADVTAEIEARTIGARLRQPALAPGRHTSGANAFFELPSIPFLPWGGSAMVYWDAGNPPAPLTNTPPRSGIDPHGRPRSQASAQLQKSEFLKPDGVVIDVCGGAPCLAP